MLVHCKGKLEGLDPCDFWNFPTPKQFQAWDSFPWQLLKWHPSQKEMSLGHRGRYYYPQPSVLWRSKSIVELRDSGLRGFMICVFHPVQYKHGHEKQGQIYWICPDGNIHPKLKDAINSYRPKADWLTKVESLLSKYRGKWIPVSELNLASEQDPEGNLPRVSDLVEVTGSSYFLTQGSFDGDQVTTLFSRDTKFTLPEGHQYVFLVPPCPKEPSVEVR